MGDKTRQISIDMAKGLAMVLVVWGHYNPYNLNHYWHYNLRNFVYLFHMPFFMMIAGYLFGYSRSITTFKEYLDFVVKKFKRLMVPYFSISISILVIKLVAQRFIKMENPVTSEVWKNIFLNPSGGFAELLWFIYTLFIIFLIYPFLQKIIKNDIFRLLVLGFLVYRLPAPDIFCLRVSFLFLVFFDLGVLINKIENSPGKIKVFLKERLTLKYVWIMIVFIISLTYLNFYNPNFLINDNFLLKITFGFGCTVLLWCFVKYISHFSNKFIRLFIVLGIYSSPIYLMHTASMAPVKIIMKGFSITNNLNFIIMQVLITLVGLLVPIIITKFFFNKIPVLSKVFLGSGPIKDE